MSGSIKEPRTGTFLGVPYDWRRHGFKARLRQRWWNPSEPRLFTPRAFGWGYAINLARWFGGGPRDRPRFVSETLSGRLS
jgi:hypothetical protein